MILLLVVEVKFSLITFSIVIYEFVLASIITLLVHRSIRDKESKQPKEDMKMPFIDSKKYCSKCGAENYLADKFCGECGEQLIFAQKIGTYVSRCSNCNSLVNDVAKYCTQCGTSFDKESELKS